MRAGFADDYRRAREIAPNKNQAIGALAKVWGKPTSTLYRWVKRCEELGYLDTEEQR